MGYYTTFDLTIRGEMTKQKAEQILQRLNEIAFDFEMFILYCNEDIPEDEVRQQWDTEAYDAVKWYDWEDQMRTLASEYPDVEFQLEGNGEDRDDWWIALFKGDRHQVEYCQPPLNTWQY